VYSLIIFKLILTLLNYVHTLLKSAECFTIYYPKLVHYAALINKW